MRRQTRKRKTLLYAIGLVLIGLLFSSNLIDLRDLQERFSVRDADSRELHGIKSLTGEVTRVADGDSLEVISGGIRYKVRLGQIDAPEYDQPWGNQAREALEKKVHGRTVEITVSDVDQYNRLVGTVTLSGFDINRLLVREGHAWVYRRYLQDRSLLKDERRAKADKLGLWGTRDRQIAPWDWRKKRRSNR